MRVPLIAARILLVIWFGFSIARAGEVKGPYANRLSQSDVAQIKTAISKAPGISHSLKKIEAVGPDKVAAQTATRTAVDEDKYYDFNIYKRSGTWTVDLNSVQVSIEKRDFRTHGPAVIR